MNTIMVVLPFIAAAAGVVSGILWWVAGAAVVRMDDKESEGGIFVNDVDLYATMNKQSRLNRYAAVATGIAAVLGGLSALHGAAPSPQSSLPVTSLHASTPQ